ncbi:MAG: nitrilase-related carbon-nitrogen hydrolase [Verrucomicrobiia bacterium]|jgi:predicted amidohydrolase
MSKASDSDRSLRVYAVQPDIIWKDANANIEKLKQTIDRVKPAPDSLVVLPEMFCSGFSMDVETVCQHYQSAVVNQLRTIARNYKVCLVAGVPMRGRGRKGRNMALGFSPQGKLIYQVAKIHSFSPAGEEKYFQSGNEVRLFNHKGWKISAFICYDLRFPEIFRAATSAGAQILLLIANWPSERAPHWIPLLQARAIENLAYVVGVNRCGNSPSHKYDGNSVIIDPWGKIIAQADDKECVITAELSIDNLKKIRNDFPALKDRKKRYIIAK